MRLVVIALRILEDKPLKERKTLEIEVYFKEILNSSAVSKL